MEHIDLRGRFGVILVTLGALVAALLVNDIKLGQDLKGGTTLRFALDIEGARRAGRVDAQLSDEDVVRQTLAIIDRRINAYGLAETNLQPVGENKFEISLPAGAEGDAQGIVDVVTQLGKLEFRIEVLPRERLTLEESEDNPRSARLDIWPGTTESFEEYKAREFERWKAARDAGEVYTPSDPRFLLVRNRDAAGTGPQDFRVLEAGQPVVGGEQLPYFGGDILESPRVGADPNAVRPVVLFDVKARYQADFGRWTGANVGMPMAIVLNDECHSAPVIKQRLTTGVQISLGLGDHETLQREAETLATVLQTGALLVRPTEEARTRMGPSLAGQSRERGVLAVGAAFALVLVFMIVYYFGSGMVANLALLLNVLMLMGFMALFRATLTLPGIAGIVLTLGMAVDANILIYERIREELRIGRTLRRAISEGYSRALSAIVDANVTSLITAAFLFQFGSGPVRGFAVTLALGLLISMFTAIYVTRTLFEWLLKRGWMTRMRMLGTGVAPKVRWLALRGVFVPISVAGVVFGLFEFWNTDRYTLYDVDFTGGFKMQAAFKEPTTPDQVGALLAKETRTVVQDAEAYVEGQPVALRLTFPAVGPYPNAQVLAVGEEQKSVEIKVQRLFDEAAETAVTVEALPDADGNRPALPGAEIYAQAEQGRREQWQAEAFVRYLTDVLGERLLPHWSLRPVERYEAPAPAEDGAEPVDDAKAAFGGGLRWTLAFVDPGDVLTADRLARVVKEHFPFWVREEGGFKAHRPADKGLAREVLAEPSAVPVPAGLKAFDLYLKSKTATGAAAEADLELTGSRLGEFVSSARFVDALTGLLPEGERGRLEGFGASEPFPSKDYVGPGYAERLKNDALLALVLSLLGIIVYVAVRFHSRSMGLAAVLCLFHDVAVTLGVVALANQLGWVDAKINLPMVAAFLTLVGFSVNDTVVIFDRIRENRGKRATIDGALIELSINQTLARTIKTSATFLLVCLALFAFNVGQRNVLEGFSFILILGAVFGTYSTVAISAPLLLFLPWLWERIGAYGPSARLLNACLSKAALILLTPLAALLWVAWALAFVAVAFIVGLVLFVPWSLNSETAKGEVRAA